MAKKFKLREGDIFTIPLNDTEYGIGQIVCFPKTKHSFIMIVFKEKFNFSSVLNIETINSLEILFLGKTVDARLYSNLWQIIGNYKENLSTIQMPYYRLGLPQEDYPDGARLVDYKGNVLANIDKETFDKLSYENEVGPIRFENALKAYFDLQEWINEDYDKILYKKTLQSVQVAKEVISKI